jgi:hypothetical protein
MNGRHAIFHGANIVDAMAIDARRNVLIAYGQALSMDAGLVQLVLVHALLGPIPPHEVRIAVTARAEFRYGRSRRLAEEALGFIHGLGWIVTRAIPTVTIGAAQSIGRVHVVLAECDGVLRRAVQNRVALDARIFGRLPE